MDVAAKIGAAEVRIIFWVIAYRLFKLCQAGNLSGTEFFAQGSIMATASQGPDSIDKRQVSEFVPCGAEVPDGMVMGRVHKIDASVADEQNILEEDGLGVVGKRFKLRV